LLRPDSGSVLLNGTALDRSHEIRKTVGALIEQSGLYGRLTLLEYLDFFAGLYDLKGHRARDRIAELLQLLELEGLSRERLGGFSLGMKQKTALARVLLHDPPILLLDEPTAGLDPLITRKVRDYLLGSRQPGRRTVLVSTHNLDEASRVCDEVAVISGGKIRIAGPWERLGRELGGPCRVTVQLREPGRSFLPLLEGVEGISQIGEAPERGRICYRAADPARTNPEVVARLVSGGAAIVSVRVGERSLEQAYLEWIGGPGASRRGEPEAPAGTPLS